MSAKKLIKLPKWAPPIPPVPTGYDAWELLGFGGLTGHPVGAAFAHINKGESAWTVWNCPECVASGIKDRFYIRAIKRPSVTPAPAKAKRAGKPVKAVRKLQALSETQGNNRGYVFVLPADADSVARMVEQAATVLAGTSGTNMSDADVAAEVLAAIGIAGRRK